MTEREQAEIYTEYHDKVFGYIHHRITLWHDAEDICADVFVKVFAHIGDFDETKSSLSTWIYNITRNTLYDYYRTTHRTNEIDDQLSQNDDFVEEICNDETLEKLAQSLEKLDMRQREIILMHYYSGRTLKQIAENLNVSYSYIKVLHSKALECLKDLFE